MQLILRTLLRTFQAQIARKIRTISSGSASAKKLDVLIKKRVYSTVGPLILEGVVGKTKYSRKAFPEERPQKHQGKEIQAKLLVTEKNE